MAIRNIYQEVGVSEYYSSDKYIYHNNHAYEISELIKDNHNIPDLNNVLDLSCGDGLVTKTLVSLGYEGIEGSDPYLYDRYRRETGKICHELSFTDIVKSGLANKYSSIICSFALHLCDKSMLPNLVWRLSQATNQLVIISPSKFPNIGNPTIEKFKYTKNNKRVHFRIYEI
jgi:hypothetical protein